MRRLLIGVGFVAASALALAQVPTPAQTPPPAQTPAPSGQQPTFRAGTALVQVDVIVTDSSGNPVTDLTQADFDVTDDGAPVPISAFKFVAASRGDWHDDVVSPIRNVDDEQREAAHDGVRIIGMFLDEFHVESHDVLRVRQSLVDFVNHLPPADLFAVYEPWDSVLDVRYTRDRETALKKVRSFEGRQGPRVMGRYPLDEDLRLQISSSAIEGIVTHIGGIGDGRKSLIVVTENVSPGGGGGMSGLLDYISGLVRSANRANVSLYPLDPLGLTGIVGMRGDMYRTLAIETGGIPMINRNDYGSMLAQVSRDASAYYLLGYTSTHPADGKFHKISVKVKRRGLSVRARSGYLAPSEAELSAQSSLPQAPKEVQSALETLADATRPDRAEPSKAREAEPTAAGPLAAPTLAVMQGRVAGPPVERREFTRAERLVVRAGIAGSATPVVTAKLLSRVGQTLADLPVTVADSVCEVRLTLAMLGQGDYIIELTGKTGDTAATQRIAFRVVAQ